MYTRNLLIPTIFRTGCGRLKGARRIQVAEQLIDHVLSNYIVTSVLAVCSIFTILWLIGTTHSIYKSGNQFLNRAVLLFFKYLFVAGQLVPSPSSSWQEGVQQKRDYKTVHHVFLCVCVSVCWKAKRTGLSLVRLLSSWSRAGWWTDRMPDARVFFFSVQTFSFFFFCYKYVMFLFHSTAVTP